MSPKPSYWRAFLTHPYNQMVALCLSGAGVFASFPFGLDALVLALLSLAAVEIVGLAIVPELPPFRAAVDKEAARAESEAMRVRLLTEIKAQGGSVHVRDYDVMRERVASLYRMADDDSTALTAHDVSQLDKLTVDYLRLCLSDAVMKNTDPSDVGASVAKKLKNVEQKLGQVSLGKDEERQLNRAKVEYEEVLARQTRMASRRSVLEASLVSMPVRMEEAYQMVMSTSSTGDLSALLEESVSKLRVAEEVAFDVEQVLGMSSNMRDVSERHEVGAANAARKIAIGRD